MHCPFAVSGHQVTVEHTLQLPSLFQRVGLPLSRRRRVRPFPQYAAEHVRHFHYRYAFSCGQAQNVSRFAAQNEAFELVAQLNKLSITVEIAEVPKCKCADRKCLSDLRAVMQAVAAKARRQT